MGALLADKKLRALLLLLLPLVPGLLLRLLLVSFGVLKTKPDTLLDCACAF